MNVKNIVVTVFVAILFSTPGCWDEPLLTELGTSRLDVHIKGTYASNSPRPWFNPEDDMSSAQYQEYVMDDSIDDLPYITDQEFPGELKLDIAEIRLEDENGKIDRFARYREVFWIDMDDTGFFGDGYCELKNDDPKPRKKYVKVHLYIRKIIFEKAKFYEMQYDDSSGSKVYDYENGWTVPSDYSLEGGRYENENQVIFAEDDTEYGFDFNLLQTNYFWDTLREESSSTNRIFPLEIPISGGLVFDNKTEQTILEIRLVMKNFIKKYEFDALNYSPAYADDLEAPVITHFYAMSDWLRDIRAGEKNIGGNLHAVARSYVPGTTGEVTGTAPGAGYVIAVPDGEDISNYYIDLGAADSLRDRYVTTCEPPVIPTQPSNSINAMMDYLLKYEEYRVKWDTFKTIEHTTEDENDMKNFIEQWHAYDGTSDDVETYDGVEGVSISGDGAARSFLIPPYAAYARASEGFVYTLENMAPGDYNVYYFPFANDETTYGTLFDSTIVYQQGDDGVDTVITITPGSSVNISAM